MSKTIRKTRRHQISPAEHLELRVLPTVNVVFNASSGLLKITGDSADNNISIEGKATPGSVDVFINGAFFDDFSNVRSINANLKDGDDQLLLAAVNIPGNLTVNLGDGADELDIDSQPNSSTNPDAVVRIQGAVKVNLGGDRGDHLDFDDAIVIGGKALFTGVADVDFNGDGNNANVQLDQDISFLSDLTIKFSGFGDENGDNLELDFDNVNVRGETLLDGSDNVERFEMTNSRFEGEFNANMDDGNDTIDIDNGVAARNVFNSQANFRGGDDNDTLFKGLDNLFARPELIADFETVV